MHGKIPQQRMKIVIVPTCKNKSGDISDAGNYRLVSKQENALRNRSFRNVCNPSASQAGPRKGRTLFGGWHFWWKEGIANGLYHHLVVVVMVGGGTFRLAPGRHFPMSGPWSQVPQELTWNYNCSPHKHEGNSAVQRIKIKKILCQSWYQARLCTCCSAILFLTYSFCVPPFLKVLIPCCIRDPRTSSIATAFVSRQVFVEFSWVNFYMLMTLVFFHSVEKMQDLCNSLATTCSKFGIAIILGKTMLL